MFLRNCTCRAALLLSLLLPFLLNTPASAQSAGTVTGTVTDNSGAVIPNAVVTIGNAVSGLSRSTKTDDSGSYTFHNLPFGNYTLSVVASGFANHVASVPVISVVPITNNIAMSVATAAQTVTVQGTAPISTDTSLRTTMDRNVFDKIPLESSTSALSSLVTMTTPGVAADSNGLFHGLGDHAENSFSVDGQPITDQQSKVFSNQLPENAVQSVSVISGAPPAQYGDKTSLIIQVVTRSGEGVTRPTGSISTSYGSFGTSTASTNISYGGKDWGNFWELDAQNSGRFLDTPEFSVFHDKGNEENAFDRIDYQFTPVDSMHLDLNYSRSWFQTPNTYDNLNVRNVISGGTGPDPVIGNVGNADQKSQIGTFDIAPTYTRLIGNAAILNIGAYVRKDAYHYYPSGDPLADLGPPTLQRESIAQERTLLNTGAHTDLTYSRNVQTIKAGADYNQTFLSENDFIGIVDATLNAPCLDAGGNPLAGYSRPSQCPATAVANANYDATLAPYDLTRGGTDYYFYGHTDVKELGTWVEDEIKTGQWFFNVGLRGDVYNGLSDASQAEPRLSAAYTLKRTGTVLRGSYARTLETPFNENLVLSSEGCANAVLSPLLNCSSSFTTPLSPGYRNEYHAGLEQNFGRHVTFSGDYIWKYTNRGFDFSVLGNTPITFPIEWTKSKIPGFAGRVDVVDFHNLMAYFEFSSVAARFFPPQVGGAGATIGQTGLPFRIDHDEKFNGTTHLQYSIPVKTAPWLGFNWRYDSGLVAGAMPCYNPLSNDPNTACPNSTVTLNGQPAIAMVDNNIPPTTNPVTGVAVSLPLTADQEFEAGMACNGVKATPGHPLPAVCPANEFTSSLISIPAPGTGDNDRNPPRVRPRSIFDVSVGEDNLFARGPYHWSVLLSAVNIANQYGLYNFLSTFSGTHYVTPRTLTAKVAFNF